MRHLHVHVNCYEKTYTKKKFLRGNTKKDFLSRKEMSDG